MTMTPDDWKLINEMFKVRDTALEHFQSMQRTLHELESDALDKSNADFTRRMEESNKWREQINEERSKFLPREVYDREHGNIENRVKGLEITRGQIKGEDMGKSAVYAAIMGIAVIVTQIVLHFWK